MRPWSERSARRVARSRCALMIVLTCFTACDERTEVLGTKRNTDAGPAGGPGQQPRPSPDAASDSTQSSRDASRTPDLDSSSGSLRDAATRSRRDGSTLPLSDPNRGFDSASPAPITDPDTRPTQAGDAAVAPPSDGAVAATGAPPNTDNVYPQRDAGAVREAGAAAREGGVGVLETDAGAVNGQTSALAPVPHYFQYPEGCEVSDEVPDPGWCSLSVECPGIVLVTDCQTDDMSWDCSTDFYSGDDWSPGFPDEYRLLRVESELVPADACSLATVLAANHFEPSGADAECSVQTGTDPSGTCTRAPGCWYPVPESPFRVWQDTARGVYCGYLNAELWDDIESNAWHCFFDRPGSELDFYVTDDGTQADACEYVLDLLSAFNADAPPSCAPESLSAQDDDCDVQLECSIVGNGNGHAAELRMVPQFDCVIEGQEAVCTCGSGSVRQVTESSVSTDGWCRDLTAACEAGLEDGSIPF